MWLDQYQKYYVASRSSIYSNCLHSFIFSKLLILVRVKNTSSLGCHYEFNLQLFLFFHRSSIDYKLAPNAITISDPVKMDSLDEMHGMVLNRQIRTLQSDRKSMIGLVHDSLWLVCHSFINLYHCQGCSGSLAYPGNIGYKTGIHSAMHMHIHSHLGPIQHRQSNQAQPVFGRWEEPKKPRANLQYVGMGRTCKIHKGNNISPNVCSYVCYLICSVTVLFSPPY